MIKTISWKNNKVVFLDQRALPTAEKYVACESYKQVITAIKNLTVRGAPAIGVAAAFAVALGALKLGDLTPDKLQKKFFFICDEINRARPTARNLAWALERMKRRFALVRYLPPRKITMALINEAKRIYVEDIEINRKIGKNGARLIARHDNILTHCNAGALATAGYGTALGVMRAAKAQGKSIQVYVDETRPVLQGARLTAWELKKEKIPFTLITDNMAGFLISQGKIDKIIVGADRIAANGDTANKIGTYSLAVLAKEHGIPFYVAAPVSTIDVSVKTGKAIPIEERDDAEVSICAGKRIAPRGTKVYNPAFDVTPAKLITAIITERGILRKPYATAIKRVHKGVSI
ncbi:MAG TPA: S-methyl-5-thioribose-1-phosphate isomerase [Smithellaceae bacterium]|nr:S-methyl-5-thioribose-1-phosphate isomerase [Smithellaceae bacterium]HRS88414.1 S-methyl-5-thioribose-1-phosphate isomerase [Smithellaceae bacterium]HRV25470.1 S-methyl-5-thioribose-1-phosphate isomerase [Smithellaceae bacterium]